MSKDTSTSDELGPDDGGSPFARSRRARLSPVALKAFRNLAQAWKLSDAEAAALLGMPQSRWERLKQNDPVQRLSLDQMTRVSALVGIFAALSEVFVDDMSRRWPRLPNSSPLFAGASPIAAMIDGGAARMLEVRRYLDALRAGSG